MCRSNGSCDLVQGCHGCLVFHRTTLCVTPRKRKPAHSISLLEWCQCHHAQSLILLNSQGQSNMIMTVSSRSLVSFIYLPTDVFFGDVISCPAVRFVDRQQWHPAVTAQRRIVPRSAAVAAFVIDGAAETDSDSSAPFLGGGSFVAEPKPKHVGGDSVERAALGFISHQGRPFPEAGRAEA